MSFCSDIKTELSEIKVAHCCMKALTYGLLLFGRAFKPQKISMQSENQSVAKLYAMMIKKSYDATVNVIKGESKNTTLIGDA